jgi:hypothetical protein
MGHAAPGKLKKPPFGLGVASWRIALQEQTRGVEREAMM